MGAFWLKALARTGSLGNVVGAASGSESRAAEVCGMDETGGNSGCAGFGPGPGPEDLDMLETPDSRVVFGFGDLRLLLREQRGWCLGQAHSVTSVLQAVGLKVWEMAMVVVIHGPNGEIDGRFYTSRSLWWTWTCQGLRGKRQAYGIDGYA
jgi:hypothetical protein